MRWRRSSATRPANLASFESNEELDRRCGPQPAVMWRGRQSRSERDHGAETGIPWRQMVDLRNFSVHASWNLGRR